MTPRLERAYAEPHRRYHSRRHIEDCLRLLDEVDGLTDEERRLLVWAIWWHDAIYDPTAPDNEDESAELALAELPTLGATATEAHEVARLIRLTKGHAVAAEDRLGAVLVSIDLSVLGAEPQDYDRYVVGVRQEYGHVPEPAWRIGRAAVMRKFLDAPVLYPWPPLRVRFEDQARANIARELSSLQSPTQ